MNKLWRQCRAPLDRHENCDRGQDNVTSFTIFEPKSKASQIWYRQSPNHTTTATIEVFKVD
jgi:hypothetical protein